MHPLALAILAQSGVASQGVQPNPPAEPSYQYFGSVVGHAGDVDRDGVPDLLLGDPGYGPGQPPRVWAISGATGTVLKAILLAQSDETAPGTQGGTGLCVDGGADLDGDGVPDLVVGVVFRNLGKFEEASITTVSGASGSVLHHWRPTATACPGGNNPQFVHDFDGDGAQDVAWLLPQTDHANGTLLIYSGRTGALVRELAIKNEITDQGGVFTELLSDRAAEKPSIALLMIAPGSEDPSWNAAHSGSESRGGSIRLYSGSDYEKEWERVLVRPRYWDWGSAALITIGDLDKDGIPDLLVGHDEIVEVVSGKSGARRFRLELTEDERTRTGWGLGCALAALGDIDKDGVPDFAYGEYDDGMFAGMVVARSGADWRILWSVTGDIGDNIHHFGAALAPVGDIDRDGVVDLAVGTDEGPDGVARGEAEVLSGRTGKRLFQFRRKGDDVVVTGTLPIGPMPR